MKARVIVMCVLAIAIDSSARAQIYQYAPSLDGYVDVTIGRIVKNLGGDDKALEDAFRQEYREVQKRCRRGEYATEALQRPEPICMPRAPHCAHGFAPFPYSQHPIKGLGGWGCEKLFDNCPKGTESVLNLKGPNCNPLKPLNGALCPAGTEWVAGGNCVPALP